MPISNRSQVQKELFRSKVYEILRDAIIRGDLAPGERVKDSELAAQIGVSRTPVREAISQLMDAGLVEVRPGVYTRITTLNRRDVTANLSVIRVLDEFAVHEAVPRLTHGQLQRMRQANDRFSVAVEAHDIDEALAADDAFHDVLVDAADNPALARVIRQLRPQIHRILYRKFSSLLGGRETIDHHGRLMDVCSMGDADGAAKLSAAHWVRLGGLIDQLFFGSELPRGVGERMATD